MHCKLNNARGLFTLFCCIQNQLRIFISFGMAGLVCMFLIHTNFVD